MPKENVKFAYYNEFDPQKAAWLRELIKRNLIAPGEVDERSIKDVNASELVGYTQCHFFAGIGIWSYALRLAGWADNRAVWTGSCPCPSFSGAGKGEGFADARHLWPDWHRLIRECRPPVVFGEQVAAAIGHGWLDLVCGEMEAEKYAIAAAVLGAHSAGAPHIRQRLYFCADTTSSGCEARWDSAIRPRERAETVIRSSVGERDNPIGKGLEGHNGNVREWRGPGWLDPLTARSVAETGATRGFWADCDWWYGRDEKYRPIGPGIQPLAHGVAARVVKLRGYGDGIVSESAAHFIAAAMEVL